MPHHRVACGALYLQVAVDKNDQLDAGDLVVFIDASQVCLNVAVGNGLPLGD